MRLHEIVILGMKTWLPAETLKRLREAEAGRGPAPDRLGTLEILRVILGPHPLSSFPKRRRGLDAGFSCSTRRACSTRGAMRREPLTGNMGENFGSRKPVHETTTVS
jgi:hypothetical protein